MIRVRLVAVLFWSYAVIWTVLLLVPDPARFLFLPAGAPGQFDYSPVPVDKIVHAGGYFLLMLLTAATFNPKPAGVGIAWLLAGVTAHGALTELLQLFIPPREGDWGDLVSDLAGAVVGAIVWRLFRRSAPSRTRAEQETRP